MISCEDALARVYEFLDGELSEGWRDRVRAHFEVCKRCYPHLACERSFKIALQRAIEGQRAPDAVRDRLVTVLSEVSDQD
jgi:mycothiol system anti-sigma-R factor